MIYFLLFVTLLSVLSWWVIQALRPSEQRLVRSISIYASPDVVFDVVSRVEQLPDWYRPPHWSTRLFGLSHLGQWGQHVRPEWRLEGARAKRLVRIQIRSIHNKEFGYQFTNPRELRSEAVFRIRPKDRGCVLLFEVGYEMYRWLDILLHRRTEERRVIEVMAASLEAIRRMSEKISMPAVWQTGDGEQQNRHWLQQATKTG